jgi:hypothetical protein
VTSMTAVGLTATHSAPGSYPGLSAITGAARHDREKIA